MVSDNFKYELFFNLSPDLLCIAGYDGYFKKVNAAVPKLLGYSLEELYSRPINDFVYHEDKDITAEVRDELTKSIPLYNFENRYVTKSGEIVWLVWTSLPVESDKLIFAIAKNITHKKKIEEERTRLLTDLTRVNMDLKQLTYTTSHDLRSPVSSLISGLDMIDVSRINDQDTIELIEILRNSGKDLKDNLNNYLDILHDKHDTLANVEVVNLSYALDNVLKSIHSLVRTSGAVIKRDFSRLGEIKYNRGYLESLYLNLVTNAIKYARPGHPPEINIYSDKTGDADILVVQDNGLGFDMENIGDKIFGFRQTFHKNKDSKGIGLYLVHSQVTSLGGRINVESNINEGTKFTILFKKNSGINR